MGHLAQLHTELLLVRVAHVCVWWWAGGGGTDAQCGGAGGCVWLSGATCPRWHALLGPASTMWGTYRMCLCVAKWGHISRMAYKHKVVGGTHLPQIASEQVHPLTHIYIYIYTHTHTPDHCQGVAEA